jgi:hypothetical protein
LSSTVDYILFPINYSGIIWLSWWHWYMSARVFLSMFFIRRECKANKRSRYNTLPLLFICMSHDRLFMLSLAQESTIALTSILRSSSRMWWLSYNTVLWTMCFMSRSKRIKSTRFVHFHPLLIDVFEALRTAVAVFSYCHIQKDNWCTDEMLYRTWSLM